MTFLNIFPETIFLKKIVFLLLFFKGTLFNSHIYCYCFLEFGLKFPVQEIFRFLMIFDRYDVLHFLGGVNF